MVGISVKPDTKMLIAPILGVGREHPCRWKSYSGSFRLPGEIG
jgi:hypothetical protein